MAPSNARRGSDPARAPRGLVRRVLPPWVEGYRREWLAGDFLAGAIVAIMLVPQAMGYALIAGLPPEVGLYASIVPLVIYALIGSSRVLAVGPVALVSLLVGAAVADVANGDPQAARQLALTLAAGVGLVQVLLGVVRAGFIVNFLSHPVISGFTSAASIAIAASQLKHILGISTPRGTPLESIVALVERVPQANGTAVFVGVSSVTSLLLVRWVLGPIVRRRMGDVPMAQLIVRAGPLIVLLAATSVSAAMRLATQANVAVVGSIPAGLPSFSLPSFGAEFGSLVPLILAIGIVGYIESYAVGHALAVRRREHLDANRELLGLGFANLGSALTSGYPVTGGLSRSVVNERAGAQSGLASIVTAGLVALTVAFLTPLLYHLPLASLGAVILVAVLSLVDVPSALRTWRYSRLDGLSLIGTFAAVLALGVEVGIAVGATISLLFLIARSSRPHIAIVGRIAGTEHFRNVRRHTVEVLPHVLSIRMDASLHFANTRALEQVVESEVARMPGCRHVLLVCSAMNFIDSSGLEWLIACRERLAEAGIQLSLAELKGPVADRLAKAGFLDDLGAGHLFLSTHQAVDALARSSGEMKSEPFM